jgi:AAA+ superfamily predicted ATPase
MENRPCDRATRDESEPAIHRDLKMVQQPQPDNVTCGTRDLNLTFLNAEMRVLWLRLERLNYEQDARESARLPSEAADERTEIEAVLKSLQTEAKMQQRSLHLKDIAEAFHLNDFERHLLLLAAAPELEEAFGEKIAQVQGVQCVFPTVGLAWRLFCPSLKTYVESRDSLRDDAPLFRFHLLEMQGLDAPLSRCFLRADRRIVDALLGRVIPDPRIAPRVRFLRPSASQAAVSSVEPELTARLGQRVREFLDGGTPPRSQLVVNCFGARHSDLEAFAERVCNYVGIPVLLARAENIDASQMPFFMREGMLLSCGLFVGEIEPQRLRDLEWVRWLADSEAIVFIGSEQALRCPRELRSESWLPIAVPRLDAWKRTEIWQRSLEESGVELNESVPALADNFEMSASEIRNTTVQAASLAWIRGEPLQIGHVMTACRWEVRHHLSELAQQVISQSAWEDLFLPEEAVIKLRELCAQVRYQRVVLDRQGFGTRLSRGRGITALLAGPSGTGKTMAAEVIAHDLHRDLYRIDLARVVSKYIGETEKNLRRAVAEAERARCVLLFDEADALFGRRTEVKDSHDRYANIEVSYLLQLLEETESAVVLLATNRREAIDEAFLRRFRFLIDFPLPDAEVRRKLWASSFPPQVDIDGVRFDVLADRLPLSGASIKNIALAATYLAASNGGTVSSKQVAHAARRELERMGRPAPFSEADLKIHTDANGASK